MVGSRPKNYMDECLLNNDFPTIKQVKLNPKSIERLTRILHISLMDS